MGVARFRGEFLGKLPAGQGKSIPANRIKHIDHLMIDMNTLLHEVANKIYCQDDKMSPEDIARCKEIISNNSTEVIIEKFYIPELVNRILSDIEVFVNFVNKPIKTIILAVDGVAPAAKINQQRQRRFTPGETQLDFPDVFTRAVITPGTEFMAKVHAGLLECLEKLKKIYSDTNFIYSSYKEYGEGEQKMFHICEDIYNSNIRNRDHIYATYGNDSDIVSLSVLRPFRVLMITFDNKRNAWEYVDSDHIKNFVCTRLISNTDRRLSSKLSLQDFVLMIMLVGNDFLPRTTMTMHVGNMINLCIKCHTKLKCNITTVDNKINFKEFRRFISLISGYEYDFVKEMSERKNMHLPSPVYQHPEVLETETDDEFRRSFRYFWYKYYSAPKSELGCKLLNITPFNYEEREHRYYDLAKIEEENIRCVSKDWIEGMSWVLDYYNNRNASRTYVYKHLYTPLMEDVSRIEKLPEEPEKWNPGKPFIDAQDQLMCVMSPDKYYLLDPEHRKRVMSGGDLEYASPIDFDKGLENIDTVKAEFMAKIKIPTIDTERVLSNY